MPDCSKRVAPDDNLNTNDTRGLTVGRRLHCPPAPLVHSSSSAAPPSPNFESSCATTAANKASSKTDEEHYIIVKQTLAISVVTSQQK
jgi:hypothetical protein